MARTELVALILAGGQGSRLGVLTKYLAKPAVPFGSRYRIIDFPLSNCSNSGIETVGVLTQYRPLALNTYVGNGSPWDLDRNKGGTYILPPYQKTGHSDWYKGTANAIFQNIEFVDDWDPRYVLILSGDHVYKMDYARMLDTHIQKEADATLAVLEVPWHETSRFGIMTTDKQGRITAFEEKPEQATSNLASMGVYIFDWAVLRQALIDDEQDAASDHDFGKNVIPKMLRAGRRLQAHRFRGYWKDVGTIESLWEANMDLLDRPQDINLRDRDWRIYSRNPVKPAHFVAASARVSNSAMTDGCRIYGTVEHSVLFNSVTVEAGAVVRDCILMPGVTVASGAVLNKCIVSFSTVIGSDVRAGADVPGHNRYTDHHYLSDGITVFERGLKIRDGAVIPGNCMVTYTEADDIIETRFRV